jgi:plasmid stabilization system protein ParE
MEIFLSPFAERKVQLQLDHLEAEWSKSVKDDYLSLLVKKFELIANHPESCYKLKEFPSVYKCVVAKHTPFFTGLRIKKSRLLR